jgi:molybdopterin-guanine dinucleotide biosynthesis protein A
MTSDYPPTLGLVLAGGLARRMGGGDKAFLKIAGKTILERVLSRFQPQCTALILNANGDPKRFEIYKLPVVADDIPDFAGPLAGILAGLDWATINAPQIEFIASVPGDCPFLPRDLVPRLHAARIEEKRPLACAKSGDWRHPVAGIWPTSLRANLRHALTREGLHKIEVWTGKHGVAVATWPDEPIDPFFNVNTPEDLARAGDIAAQNSDC